MYKNRHALASRVHHLERGPMLSLLIKVLRKGQAEERGENGAISVAPPKPQKNVQGS